MEGSSNASVPTTVEFCQRLNVLTKRESLANIYLAKDSFSWCILVVQFEGFTGRDGVRIISTV